MEGEPLDPAAATRLIRGLLGPSLMLRYTRHARERMLQRDLIVGDILHVLRHGFVYQGGEESSTAGLFKYTMECITPNSGGRTVRLILIPSKSGSIEVITVMWADERS